MKNQAKDLTGKVALISGASSGLGRAIAALFAAAGINLMLTGRDAARLAAVAAELMSDRISIHTAAGDLQDEQFCHELVTMTVAHFGHIDILVNNAGMIDRQPLVNTSTAIWRCIMQTNVDAVFFLCRAAIPHLPSGSSIINVASTVSSLGASNLVAYCTSKGAIATFTKALAIELAPQHINVNATAPGAMQTPMLLSEHPVGTDLQYIEESNRQSIPQGRFATSEEVARSVLFLAQEPHITGSILAIDGGYTAQ